MSVVGPASAAPGWLVAGSPDPAASSVRGAVPGVSGAVALQGVDRAAVRQASFDPSDEASLGPSDGGAAHSGGSGEVKKVAPA